MQITLNGENYPRPPVLAFFDVVSTSTMFLVFVLLINIAILQHEVLS